MKKFLLVFAVCVASLIATPVAEAGFLFVSIFDGTSLLTVQDNDVNDLDDTTDGSIIVRSSALLGAFSHIIAGSGVRTSTSTAVDLSTMETQVTFKGDGAFVSDFTVTSWQTGFVLPADPKDLHTSGSFTFGFSGLLGTGAFRGGVGTTDNPLLIDKLDALISAVSTSNASSDSGSGTGFLFNSPSYVIQNVLKAHVPAQTGVSILVQGTTNVQIPAEVPEPSTIVMLMTMAGPLALCAYRRCRS